MPEYLSPEWTDALDRLVRARVAVTVQSPVVIEQVVRDVPGRGRVRYQLRIDGAGARVIGAGELGSGGGDGRQPDVRLTIDYRTAVAIARGEENAQGALARGRLRIGGDAHVLVRHAAVLAALDGATAELRSATTYPQP